MKSNSSKFYYKSLTQLVDILNMINQGKSLSHIANALGGRKSLVSYYVNKAKALEYVNEVCRDRIKVLELSQQGKTFLAQYSKAGHTHFASCRVENIRLIASIHRPPTRTPDWRKVEMNNWSQYRSVVDRIRVHYNDSKKPSIEFLPSSIVGDDPWQLCGILYHECSEVAEKLEEVLDMEIGRLKFEPGIEWVVYDPVAKLLCKYNGQITIDGIGKVNASKPYQRGEVEYFDPRRASEYFTMPQRLSKVERLFEEQNNFLRNMYWNLSPNN